MGKVINHYESNLIIFVLFNLFLTVSLFIINLQIVFLILLLSMTYKSIFWRVNGQNDVDLCGIYGHITFQIL